MNFKQIADRNHLSDASSVLSEKMAPMLENVMRDTHDIHMLYTDSSDSKTECRAEIKDTLRKEETFRIWNM